MRLIMVVLIALLSIHAWCECDCSHRTHRVSYPARLPIARAAHESEPPYTVNWLPDPQRKVFCLWVFSVYAL